MTDDERFIAPQQKFDPSIAFSTNASEPDEKCSSDFLESASMLLGHEYTSHKTTKRFGSSIPALWCIIGIITYTLLVIFTSVTVAYNHYVAGGSSRDIGTLISGGDVCGTEIETALAAGCKFDTLSLTWLPPQCYDERVTQSSSQTLRELAGLTQVNLDKFQFFHDINRTQLVTDVQFQAASLLNFGKEGVQTTFYTDTVYHKAHCQHVKELQDSALQKASEGKHDVWLWERAAKWEHSLHCHKIMYLEKWNTPELDVLAVYPGTSNCILIRRAADS
ncbi:hypothetical protein BGZ60DRAFT_436504 [Tricladium varicosporioides]|nr:hypothetical protein BGZ60DRAFT_436504 [Hymenoscyphus varicosporioides]